MIVLQKSNIKLTDFYKVLFLSQLLFYDGLNLAVFVCLSQVQLIKGTWWHHQMEALAALQTLCAGNSPVTGELPTQRPATRSFDVFFDLRLNKPLGKQSQGWWFEMLSRIMTSL